MCTVVVLRSNPVNPDPPVEKLSKYLEEAGYKVIILAWDRSSNFEPQKESVGNRTIIRLGAKGQFSGGIRRNLSSLIKFQKFIYNWLHHHSSEYQYIHAFDFDTAFIALKCARKLKKYFVYGILDYYVDSHGLKESFIGAFVKKAEDKIINSADTVTICTEKRREQIKGTNPHNLLVIHNTPDITFSLITKSEIKIVPSDRLKIVYVGIFGGGRFIDEMLEIVSRRDDLELHIGGFGKGMESKIENYSKQYSNIFYYGKIPYSDTLALERQCDIMTAIYNPDNPNHKYAAPNKFYEALMLGKPLIMARGTGFDDIILENKIGVVMDYTSESFMANIENLIQLKDHWKEMGAKARHLYETEFSWEIMKKRLDTIYKK